MHHPTDRITHTTAFVTPVVEQWLEREIAQWVHPMKDRSDDPSYHERMLYLWATSRSWQREWYIEQSLLYQSWSSGWNEKQLNGSSGGIDVTTYSTMSRSSNTVSYHPCTVTQRVVAMIHKPFLFLSLPHFPSSLPSLPPQFFLLSSLLHLPELPHLLKKRNKFTINTPS